MLIRSTVVLSLAAGSLVSVSSGDVVIQPTAVTEVSTWRACVPQINIINGNGLSNAAAVTSGSPIPGAWPTHGTGGCNNMWHTSCIGQSGSECEGGVNADLAPYIIFDLGSIWDLTGFHLWNHNQVAPGGASETNRGFRNMNVEVSSDGINYSSPVPFTDVARGPGSTAYAGDDYGLPANNVRYVKFTVLNNWGSTGVTGLSEVRFTGNPRFGILNSAVSPSSIEPCGPESVVVSTRVVGLASGAGVSVAASGGPITAAFEQMLDNGANGDATAGDGIYSTTVTVPGGFPQGDSVINIGAEDTLGNTSFATVTLNVGPCNPTYNEDGDAGELPSTAAVAVGLGPINRIRGTITTGDTDMYKITICDPDQFYASAVGGTTFDTQLFLFDLQGMGIACNDDTPAGFLGAGTLQSTLAGAPAAGDYYIAIAPWDRDPLDNTGQELFLDQPFNVQHTADGPGGANQLDSWAGAAAPTGAYTITFLGACFVTDTPPACPADVGTAGGEPGQDGLLDNNDFIAFINFFFEQNPIADQGVAGGEYGSDGLYDNNDFIAFINHFFDGCDN